MTCIVVSTTRRQMSREAHTPIGPDHRKVTFWIAHKCKTAVQASSPRQRQAVSFVALHAARHSKASLSTVRIYSKDASRGALPLAHCCSLALEPQRPHLFIIAQV